MFDELKMVVFVHGCFWHAHSCRESSAAAALARRSRLWRKKFEMNRRRDENALARLQSLGWKCLVVWECESRDEQGLRSRLAEFIGDAVLFDS